MKEEKIKLKETYKGIADLVNSLPNGYMIHKTEIENKKSKYKRVITVFPAEIDHDTHFGDITNIFLQVKNNRILALDMKKLQGELAKVFLGKFSPEKFINDFVKTIDPLELIEAYDRAVVRKGKVKDSEGCYKFLLYGKRGAPQELMIRN